MRLLLVWGLLALPARAHGGVFRPPPALKPGDIFTPKKGRPTITKADGRAPTLSPWRYWWRLNRAPIMRLRKRLLERVVVTGKRRPTRLFDRAAVRKKLVPILLDALKDEDQAVRTAAAVALGKLEVREASPLLKDLYRKDQIRDVRESALMGLMLMRDPANRDWLRGVAKSQKAARRVRGLALLGLGFLKDEPFLLDVMRGKATASEPAATERELRASATLALGFCEDPALVLSFLEAMRDARMPEGVAGYAGTCIARLGNPIALPEMLKLINDSKRKVHDEARYGAAIAVGRLVRPDDETTIDLLGRKAQRDKDRGVRALLLLSLGRIGGDRAVTHIVAGMTKSEAPLRGFHYIALGLSGHAEAGPLLVDEFSKCKTPDHRSACVLALGLCGYRDAAPLIRAELAKRHPGFVEQGMVALGLLNDKAAIPLIEKIVAEIRVPMVRREGAIALALLKGTAAVPQLLDLMKSGKSTLSRGAVSAALGLVGTERCVEPLLAIYRNKKLKDEERALALASLGSIADPAAVSLLRRFSEDLNPYVICESAQELLNIL